MNTVPGATRAKLKGEIMAKYLVETEENLCTGAFKFKFKGPVPNRYEKRFFERGGECEVYEDTFGSEKAARDYITTERAARKGQKKRKGVVHG